jgi:hypothetical protein
MASNTDIINDQPSTIVFYARGSNCIATDSSSTAFKLYHSIFAYQTGGVITPFDQMNLYGDPPASGNWAIRFNSAVDTSTPQSLSCLDCSTGGISNSLISSGSQCTSTQQGSVCILPR